MRRFSLLGGWLVVVVLATTATWQIVSAADDQVSLRPIAPLNVAAPVLSGVDTSTTQTTQSASSVSSAPSATTTSVAAPSTSMPESSSSTAPTTSASVWKTKAVQTSGGSVILQYRPGQVRYQSAAPAPGYQVEVEKPGPPEVKVEFESESHKVEVEASWGDGDLVVNISEDNED